VTSAIDETVDHAHASATLGVNDKKKNVAEYPYTLGGSDRARHQQHYVVLDAETERERDWTYGAVRGGWGEPRLETLINETEAVRSVFVPCNDDSGRRKSAPVSCCCGEAPGAVRCGAARRVVRA